MDPGDRTHAPGQAQAPEAQQADAPGRPWAAGIGLVLLGLALSAAVNTLSAQLGGAAALAGWAASMAVGLLVAGSGVHRILWAHPTRRSRAARLAVTAVVTPLVFAALLVVVSVILTITQQRFR